MAILTISSVQRAALRTLAHSLKPTVLIGNEGLSDAVLNEIDCHLKAHELIKIRVFGDERQVRLDLYQSICEKLKAAPIQHIGKLLVIWRPAPATSENSAPHASSDLTEKKAAGGAPRIVKIVKRNPNSLRRIKPKRTLVLGNQRVTAGGLIKRAKKRLVSKKLSEK